MRLFDLHCDTLYEAITKNKSLINNDLHISVSKGTCFEKWNQCFAIWLPDGISFSNAKHLFLKAANKFRHELNCMNLFNENFSGNYNAIFTVENGIILNGDLENIKLLTENGVKILTLTWNGKNCFGNGADVADLNGITDFGKKAVKELEKNKIVIDVSHASEKLFYDVAQISVKPFIATHSNAFSITPHRRNLTDEQFKVIKERGGLVGINFYKCFLNTNGDKASKYDILRHTEHFLGLGGEDVVCFGTDFDGAEIPNDIKGIESLPNIYEMFLQHNYNESVLNKIFFQNANTFFENFDFYNKML